jgi:general transcription factor 3C polypeptide 2
MSKLIYPLTLEAFILHVVRCVILSFDDGTMRILSLVKAAYDAPVTGKPFGGTKQQGLHSYYCSSFAIWSVQVSRLTGISFIFLFL